MADAAVSELSDAIHSRQSTAWLALGALGVVFGDIGTSPLYALHETFAGHHQMAVEPMRVMGVISVIFWTMLLIVTFKYVTIMMRADNKGEGGSLSLLALISRHSGPGRWTAGLTILGVFATALFFGDAMITPAVSVLSAVEGLEVLNPDFARFVLPVAVAILVGLFSIQSHGTERVGAIFGPVMLVYFVTLALLGIGAILREPRILASLSPTYGARFIAADPATAFLALGSIVLAVTGAETLYADMSHFGRGPIRLAWLLVAFPTLMLNYLGQGALLLGSPQSIENPFYLLAPDAWRPAMIVLATLATIIASQAVITGAFSVMRQAVQLGLFPRLNVLHTSERAEGQIYLPLVNWSLLVTVVLLVLAFKTSTNLASAYGIAVTGTMLITTVMLAVVLTRLWHWPKPLAFALIAVLATVDGVYFASNLTKFADGGWFPLLVAAIAFTMLTTWAKGRALVRRRLAEGNMPVDVFVQSVAQDIHRVRGTAIYLTAQPEGIPPSLLHNLKHNQVLHEQVILLTVSFLNVPRVKSENRVSVEDLGGGLRRVLLRYGFSEDPDIPVALASAKARLGPLPPMSTSYFISRQTVIAGGRPGMALWREKLFGWMVRNSATAMEFFRLPANRVVELGSQVQI
ncbi:potassium transporter Kup [Sphingomonas sp. MAH-20]|uniref:Probable potassium transport system protein Kup n=1 Tax=Sphingomonas horti TaxID=2682842 RepID=A0A6I4J0X2_9SPHN|nr:MULTISPECIES: potassium transporter Kup [Sphingomonas]MBA2918274.1 potassium transporter Kup [Sphingomonas sp. CGMCC 1.13658]MVO77241.1 potassium transporter Kup [Sphingomonas horti]